MKKNTLIFATLVSAVLTLSACGDSSSEGTELTSTPVEPATSSTTASPTDPVRSPRGNIIKTVGQPAGVRIQEGSDEWALKFTVTDIQVDPVCTSVHSMPGDNGHLIALSIEATTAPEPQYSTAMGSPISFDSWKVIASNGTTVNTTFSQASVSCFEGTEMIPNSIGAGEKAVGRVVLDVPDTAGTLVYMGYGGDGWEWEYGTKK
ncbi:hypothetical protein ABIB35_003350 [Arthrobacter sp. UYP6]|uniref:hypothetical protein n=1 Tax=Arthrobacter sp. UYP6 TaxID=1756378 RepID=UPI0033991C99